MMKCRIEQPAIRALLITVFCTLVLSCSTRQSVICEVPLVQHNELLALEVMINKQGPFKFILDTGFSNPDCFLRADMIDQLDLVINTTLKSSKVYHPASQHPIIYPRFGPADISIGRLTISNIGFFVDQESPLNSFMEKNDIDGIIGVGQFKALDLVIALDLSEQQFRIGRSAAKLGLTDDDLIETAPLSSNFDEERIGVLINVEGHDIPALLDTGSVFGLGLPIGYMSQLETTGESTLNSSITIGGELEHTSSTLTGHLKIGRHTIDNATVRFSSTSNDYGTVGCEMLNEFRIIGFDFRNNKIFLD